jgi:hypothetical protein
MIRQFTRGGEKNGETPEIPQPETAQVALLSFQNLGGLPRCPDRFE